MAVGVPIANATTERSRGGGRRLLPAAVAASGAGLARPCRPVYRCLMKEPLRVYLVRHGRAERDAPGGDAARRLTPEGRARFFALAGAIATKLDLSRIVASPFARARQTAEILAAATGAPIAENPDLAPGRSTGADILAWARSEGAGVALVGHNPEMAEAVALAAGRSGKLPPGAVAAVDLGDRGPALAWIEAPDAE